jgi:Skp family chaperone for outer membrane proteins
MKSLTMMVAVAAASTMLATSAYAQAAATPNPQKPAPTPTAPAPPATQQKPATPPAPQPPRPFPEGSKFAFVDIQVIASNSAEGKAATAKLDELRKKKNTELQSKATAVKGMQDKLQAGGTVLSDSARAQLQKDIEKGQRDLEYAQQDAQTEVQDMTNQLQEEFQTKLNPILEQIRADKGLLMIFSSRDAGIVAADMGLDLSDEVIKRFDATKTAPKK